MYQPLPKGFPGRLQGALCCHQSGAEPNATVTRTSEDAEGPSFREPLFLEPTKMAEQHGSTLTESFFFQMLILFRWFFFAKQINEVQKDFYWTRLEKE